MKFSFVIIGGGLSGLAAAIRYARYSPDVLLLEQHHRVGGLNSYYHRGNKLLETGLHAVTNYAPANAKHAPLNRLFRQLKISRKSFITYPQCCSEIHFPKNNVLRFSNDFRILKEEIAKKYSTSYNGFTKLVDAIAAYDPFQPQKFRSAKKFVLSYLDNELLTDMLLCPLMYYGSSTENDIDLSQFVIMFRSIYQEGMFRPDGTIKDFLDNLLAHYTRLGGTIKLNSKVVRILTEQKTARAVELDDGEQIECDHLISTIGADETLQLTGTPQSQPLKKRLGFIESIFLADVDKESKLPKKKTILFFSSSNTFNYSRPKDLVDYNSGVICFPGNFEGRPEQKYYEIRSTHLANYGQWAKKRRDEHSYSIEKDLAANQSARVVENYIGTFQERVIFRDTFTPLTIKRYTSKIDGAIYGSPVKIKDGNIGFTNLFLAGTDQGFLGIIGSMLSGVSMVNQHILPKI